MQVSPKVNFDELARSTDEFNGAQLKVRIFLLALIGNLTEL